jgi:small subunit ribosomal protein S17
VSEQTSTPTRTLTGTKIGVVVSDKRDKTCTVAVDYQQKHKKYGKYLHRQAKFQVHDPENQCGMGDRVEITGCRPISKTKSWRLVKVVEKALAPIEAHDGSTA